MAIQELTLDQIESLVGTRNIITGIEYPENGMQPYYEWLVQTLDLLSQAASSGAALKVNADDSGPTVVIIAPGTAVLGGAVMSYAAGTLDLAFFNNDVAHLWLYDNSGSAAVGVAGSVDGWPTTPHLKLAEVTLSAGVITSILDHRTDLTLTDLNPANISGTSAAGFLVNDQSNLARLQLDTNAATGDFILALSPSNLTANRRWTFPDTTDIVVGVAATQTLTNKTLASATINDGVITGAAITGLSSPSGSSDAATKGYVDSVAQGLDIKQSVRAATTANITLSGLQTIDGVSIQADDRVLVKDQDSADENGIYAAASGGWPRASDADSSAKVTAGLATFVTDGSTQADTMWVLATDDPITLGTTGLVFTQFGAGILAVEDDPAPVLGGDLAVGFHAFTTSDGTPLISFADDSFGNHQIVLGTDTVAPGRSFLDTLGVPYLIFDSGGAPAAPLVIQNSGDGTPVLYSSGPLMISAGSSIDLDTSPLGGTINHNGPCYFGKYVLLSGVDGALVYAQDVPFKDNLDDENIFLLFNSSDLSLNLGTNDGPVVLEGNAFSIFGATPAAVQPCGVEAVSLTDDSGGTADGGGIVAAIGAGTLDSSAASQADVQNAFATVIAAINQLTIQVNKQRSLLLAFGWGFDETP